MQSIQSKIDRYIKNANYEFNNNKNVLLALLDYTKALELFDFLDKKYNIQIHEVLVRISICFDISGNYEKALEYITQANLLVKNVSYLILYKAVLLFTTDNYEEAIQCLLHYKRICPKKNSYLNRIFKLLFLYARDIDIEQNSKTLIKELSSYFKKYKSDKDYLVYYIRAMTYLKLSQSPSQNDKINKIDYIKKYEADVKICKSLEPDESNILFTDGISSENLSKIFFLIIPEMDNYQPKALVNYSTFFNGKFGLFYTIFKAIKLFKIKTQKKKLQEHYNNKLKNYNKNKNDSTDSFNADSSNISNPSANANNLIGLNKNGNGSLSMASMMSKSNINNASSSSNTSVNCIENQKNPGANLSNQNSIGGESSIIYIIKN